MSQSTLQTRIASSESGLFHESLAGLCDGELPLDRALRVAGDELADGPIKLAVLAMADDVARGRPFEESYREHAGSSEVYAALIAAGVSCDQLPSVLHEIAREEQRRESMHEQLDSALARPTMSAFLIGCIGLLVLLVMPSTQSESIVQLGAWHVSPETASKGISNAAWLRICTIGLSLIVACAALVTLFVRRGMSADRLATLPLLRGLGEQAQRARYLSTLALLVRRGVPLHRATELAQQCLGAGRLSAEAEAIAKRAEQGASLTQLFASSPLVSQDLAFYLASQDANGHAADGLQEITRIEEQRFERGVARFTRVAGPAFEVVIGVVVLVFAMGYLHPALRMFGSLWGLT